jgi:hypothetical protein
MCIVKYETGRIWRCCGELTTCMTVCIVEYSIDHRGQGKHTPTDRLGRAAIRGRQRPVPDNLDMDGLLRDGESNMPHNPRGLMEKKADNF